MLFNSEITNTEAAFPKTWYFHIEKLSLNVLIFIDFVFNN